MNLLSAIDATQFGQIENVTVEHDVASIPAVVSENQRDLIALIRSGTRYFDSISVHRGEPVIAETSGTDFGFRCRKKIKFPTE
jgi:hypothetical protein